MNCYITNIELNCKVLERNTFDWRALRISVQSLSILSTLLILYRLHLLIKSELIRIFTIPQYGFQVPTTSTYWLNLQWGWLFRERSFEWERQTMTQIPSSPTQVIIAHDIPLPVHQLLHKSGFKARKVQFVTGCHLLCHFWLKGTILSHMGVLIW